jgi:hypothetical protein
MSAESSGSRTGERDETRSRCLLLVGVVVALLAVAGCSVSSTVNPPRGMVCVKAHDEYHDGVVEICDLYAPTASPSPTEVRRG